MGEWLNELDVPIPWNMAISKKEHSADTFNNLHKSPENYAKLKKKKPVPKDHILYGSIFITFLKWQNYKNREQLSGCQGPHGGSG